MSGCESYLEIDWALQDSKNMEVSANELIDSLQDLDKCPLCGDNQIHNEECKIYKLMEILGRV